MASPFRLKLAAAAAISLLFARSAIAIAGESPASDSTQPTGLAGSTQSVILRVRVAPTALAGRDRDERPAEFQIKPTDLPAGMRMDLSSLVVVRIDPRDGGAGQKPLPLRWYDAAVPYNFAEVEDDAHATDGLHFRHEIHPRWGDYYNLTGEGRGGRLVWPHTQLKNQEAHYEIHFRVVPTATTDPRGDLGRAPRGFVGDGSNRCAIVGDSSTDMIHSRVTLTDFNGDGLVDMLVGGARGAVLAYPNRGTRSNPSYPSAELVFTSDGKPLDVGWSAAPLAVDWDGDGKTDLLCGAERNRILFYRNVSQSRSALPRYELRGFVTADKQPIVLPTSPVPEGGGVFTMDYYPVLDAVDWNGDGRCDLLAGGFITGRVYLYESNGRNPDGTPRLTFRDAILADGKPLDVGWAAAPCAADFDGDGDLDLICGSMPVSSSGRDQSSRETFLRYYENVGTKTAPRLVERPFPKTGQFPDSILATPRAADVNGDGLLDLVVSASFNVYVYLNVGTKTHPVFAAHATPLPNKWGGSALPTFGVQFLDFDGDGKQDMLCSLSIYHNKGDGTYSPQSLLPAGNRIDHPAKMGDGWIFTQLADLDGDGRRDLLYGTHGGNIYFHRNEGRRYEEPGIVLKLEDGKPLHVGPEPGQALDFDVLQGARITFAAADFDGDGRIDLAVGDTYGKLRYFHNVGSKTQPLFAKPVQLGDLKLRMVPYACDWDRDGRPDIIGSSANGRISLFRNLGGNRFAKGEALAVPPVPYSPTVMVTDWNGDGDDDLIIGTAYGYFCWFERSFLERGYAAAERDFKVQSH